MGRLVVAEAIARGHTVRALVRDRAKGAQLLSAEPSLPSAMSPGPRPCPRWWPAPTRWCSPSAPSAPALPRRRRWTTQAYATS
ncbi:hypothetical protein [Streptomyces sp. SP18BB07]|uniref:hypothetical protein n=1 Tax=Streptomyces sp. SP18BB07 TaxID=3002522 RepID=UPI002E7A7029|nr:hypothetical protein [Streptomyces sp. SP18BB07]MEE1765211.1 hypothetical protein [Streptomyces sp. SP18BB07]